jgi:hypothetical protein
VDIANVVLHVPSPPRIKSPKASDDAPLQLQRELVDGIPSDILPEPFIQREGNVVSPLNHPTKPFVMALPPEDKVLATHFKHDCASFELYTPVIDECFELVVPKIGRQLLRKLQPLKRIGYTNIHQTRRKSAFNCGI